MKEKPKRYQSLSSLPPRVPLLEPSSRIKALPKRVRDQTNRDRGRLGRLMHAEVLRRDSRLCRMCSTPDRLVPYAEVDHIVALIDEGEDTVSNLWCLCRACHLTKTANEVAARSAGLPPPVIEVRPPVLPPSDEDDDGTSRKYRVW